MPSSARSLISLKSLNQKQIDQIFSETRKLKTNFSQHALSSGVYHSGYKGTSALLFFEPSTRTRFSFEAASSRSGYHPLILDGGLGTSLEKGESVEDTIFNIEALRPLFFVIRCNDLTDLELLNKRLTVPIINAGWGRRGHPTQALLDGLTIHEKFGSLKGLKILFVGDIKHSRVVSSHLELAEIMGYKIGFCAPEDFLRVDSSAVAEVFSDLTTALEWADVVVALRVQKERHDSDRVFLIEDYRDKFSLNNKTLKSLKPQGMIMHPGPINYGVELDEEVLTDSRSVILKQVENGVFLREALIRRVMEG